MKNNFIMHDQHSKIIAKKVQRLTMDLYHEKNFTL